MCSIVPKKTIFLLCKTKIMDKQILLILFLLMLLLGCGYLNAQSNRPSDPLYAQISHLDSTLFNAFNSRDTVTFKKFFSEDLEFYHDKGGLTGYQNTIDFINSVAKNKTDLKRNLVSGTLEVYPIPNYGAMEIGAHTFCHHENGKQDCGTFKFVLYGNRLETNGRLQE